MLEISHVSKSYRRSEAVVRAIDDVSLSLSEGDFVAVQGTSGSGKTTLLMVVGALLEPDAGEVTIGGRDPYAIGPEERSALRAAAIGFVFQECFLVPYLTVLDNVLTPSLARPDSEAPARARALVERFGLADRVAHTPAELSAGERQRVALARALLNRPKLLLADEPTGNLDEKNADVVLRALAEFARQGGVVLLVTHHAEIAGRAGRIIKLEAGRLLRPDVTVTAREEIA